MECDNVQNLGNILIEQLFAAPGSFKVTLSKNGDRIDVLAGTPHDFMNLREVAELFGVTSQTIRRRFVHTNQLKRTQWGYKRSDVEALLAQYK